MPSRYVTHGRELADGRDAVLALLDRLHDESIAEFRALTPDMLAAKCTTPEGTPLTRWKRLRMLPEHEYPPPRPDLHDARHAGRGDAVTLRDDGVAGSGEGSYCCGGQFPLIGCTLTTRNSGVVAVAFVAGLASEVGVVVGESMPTICTRRPTQPAMSAPLKR